MEQRRARRLGRRREVARSLVVQQVRTRFVLLGPLHVGVGRAVYDNVDAPLLDRSQNGCRICLLYTSCGVWSMAILSARSAPSRSNVVFRL